VLRWIALAMLAGCGVEYVDHSDSLVDPQLPPRGHTLLAHWLDDAYYQAWTCEPAGHEARSPSPHPRNRICNNAVLHAAAGEATFPVGAASVKELLDDGDGVIGYAVTRKVEEAPDGEGWYWFELQGSHLFADGQGADNCIACHHGSGHDYVYTLVP
jgi:hypothetical protein